MLRCSDLPVAITFSTYARIALELMRGNARAVEAVALKLGCPTEKCTASCWYQGSRHC